MIILDTNILWPLSPDSSSADLLRAIRAAGVHKVAVPWMVMEELAAQQAIKYREKHQKAAEALESLRQVTPGSLGVELEGPNEGSVRHHWRNRWSAVLETIPTSEGALRMGFSREMNKLLPCREVKGLKIGGRDAAIWLSAVEYAREHPDETVYFVSTNTKDFTDGSSYPSPMCDDIAGLEGRFVHLTSMDDIASQFTEPAETDDALVVTILKSPEILDLVTKESRNLTAYEPFRCIALSPLDGVPSPDHVVGWRPAKTVFSSVERIHTYRIGDHEWCTADVEWHVGGFAFTVSGSDLVPAGCTWTTSVLFTPDAAEPRLTVLRSASPRPLLSQEAFEALDLRDWSTNLEKVLMEGFRASAATVARLGRLHPLRGPRAYEGALSRDVAAIRLGDTSAG
ncbi:PIN domain-containing protein [Streptomyces europaeiscabiei]|uniref:PIN domain-containing protein n=1 Tax=Streptomyces europaeiscabiei TaxID=146819 RepID=UPI002E13E715|nr:PIN domain-containing protein [Streptomyces europaeiscabiei]